MGLICNFIFRSFFKSALDTAYVEGKADGMSLAYAEFMKSTMRDRTQAGSGKAVNFIELSRAGTERYPRLIFKSDRDFESYDAGYLLGVSNEERLDRTRAIVSGLYDPVIDAEAERLCGLMVSEAPGGGSDEH